MTSHFSPDSGLVAKAKVLQHPPHSPHLAPSDFYLFGPFKNFLSRKSLRTKTHCKKTVVQYFTSLGKEHYLEGIFINLQNNEMSEC
jgi:hypothetical protein